ncbi:hypothetical protein IAU59_005640 [Kwoniella sp. CBS 9459]
MSLSDAQVEQLARKTLGLDEEPDEITPSTYLALFKEHIHLFPYDTNFIVELAEPDRKGSSLGGNGFGIVTCMEDACWKDVVLSADPRRPEGGKQDGIGSFSDFQDHCQEAEHIKARSERCKRLGISMSPTQREQPATTTTINTAPTQHLSSFPSSSSGSSSRFGQSQSVAGPSRQPRATSFIDLEDSIFEPSSSSSTTYRRQAQPQSSSPARDTTSFSGRNALRAALPPSSPPLPPKRSSRDIKPLTSQTRTLSLNMDEPIVVSGDSDDDDDVQPLLDSDIPDEFKKVTNADDPIVLTDDSDDDEIAVKPRGKGKPVARTGSSQIPLAPIFGGSQRAKIEPVAGPPSAARGPAAIDLSRSGSGDSIEAGAKAFDALFSNDSSSSSSNSRGRNKAGHSAGLGIPILSADERIKRLEEEERAVQGSSGNAADVKPGFPVAPALTPATLSDENTKYYDTEEKYYRTTIIQCVHLPPTVASSSEGLC